MSAFKPGDMVRDRGGEEYTISYGPYVGPEGETYLVADSREVRHPVRRVFLSAVPPEDPRVGVVAKTLYESHYGVGSWVLTLKGKHDDYRDDARAVLAALDAMSQESR